MSKTKPPKQKKPPAERKPWERPLDRSPNGDSEPDYLYLMVGRCLSRWEDVEEHLGQIFALLVGLQEPSASAVRAYGAIATNRGRSDMIAAAAEVYFSDFPDPALQETFRGLMTAVAGYGGRRNDIAHGTVRSVKGASPPEFFLVSPLYNTSKIKMASGSVYAYTADNLLTYLVRFTDLYIDLDNFYWRFVARVAARESYGGTLTPAQIEALDHLLLNPTAQRQQPPPESSEA